MNRQKLRTIVLLTGLIFLSGCGTAAVYNACPVPKIYSSEFNKALADELEKAGQKTIEAMSDYYVLRRQVEACRKD